MLEFAALIVVITGSGLFGIQAMTEGVVQRDKKSIFFGLVSLAATIYVIVTVVLVIFLFD
jgi:hypothetical protein